VHLQALSDDPRNRPLEWAWAVCPEPASSSVQDCLAQIAADTVTGNPLLLGSGAGQDSAVLPIPADALDGVPEGARSQALVGVLSVACPGHIQSGPIDPSEPSAAGAGLPFRCVDADSGAELGLHDTIFGIKRIFLREAESNDNPVIDQILFDGEPWDEIDIQQVAGCDSDGHAYDDCKPSGHRVAAVVSPDSFGSGTDEFGRPFSEELIVQHYTTDGIFKDEVRIAGDPETSFAARQSASGTTVRLWFVVRDDRGGVSWATRQVTVQ
jgi:hypothetical protein